MSFIIKIYDAILRSHLENVLWIGGKDNLDALAGALRTCAAWTLAGGGLSIYSTHALVGGDDLAPLTKLAAITGKDSAGDSLVIYNNVELASLDTRTDAAMTTNTTPAISEPTVDMRKVTGTLVNMRNGPGTRFHVVDQLSRGASVEVLADPGEGWVRLKVTESNRVGWMSDDFLRVAAD